MSSRSPFSALFAVVLLGCGSPGGSADDAGADVVYGHKPLDAGSAADVGAEAKTPWNRMTPHGGVVLSAPHVWAIYIGTQGVDLSPSYDSYLSWLVTSTDWWSIMAQYGVNYGSLDGSTVIDTAAFFPTGTVNNGFVNWFTLDQRIAEVIHASTQADAGAPDAADDGGDASTPPLPAIPKADAYIVFLPDGVNVDLSVPNQPPEFTCQGVGGYHSYDGQEPYSIIPPCRMKISVSHEMAEMVTDPLPGQGWFSDTDQLGEIGDLCNWLTSASGHQVTALWSNKDGDCEPAP